MAVARPFLSASQLPNLYYTVKITDAGCPVTPNTSYTLHTNRLHSPFQFRGSHQVSPCEVGERLEHGTKLHLPISPVWVRYCPLPSWAHLLLDGPVWRCLSPAGYSHGRCCPGRLNFPQRLISTLKRRIFTWSNPTRNNHTNTIKCQPSQSSCGHFLATLR